MNVNCRESTKRCLAFQFLSWLLWAQLSADYSSEVELLEFSNLKCGERVNADVVRLIDLQAMLNDKSKAVAMVNELAPEHGIESPVPILIEKTHLNGKVRKGSVFRNAIRESAFRGCDLLIVLDYQVFEKTMFRPDLMELKLPVSYILVLFGSQKRNSAHRGNR